MFVLLAYRGKGPKEIGQRQGIEANGRVTATVTARERHEGEPPAFSRHAGRSVGCRSGGRFGLAETRRRSSLLNDRAESDCGNIFDLDRTHHHFDCSGRGNGPVDDGHHYVEYHCCCRNDDHHRSRHDHYRAHNHDHNDRCSNDDDRSSGGWDGPG
jgi:hypothetical protein